MGKVEINVVASKYDQQAEVRRSFEERAKLRTAALSSFHNWVKLQLLQRNCPPGGTLLDLGCGRGGDLNKWQRIQLSRVTGLDSSPISLEEARRRYQQRKPSAWSFDFETGLFDIGSQSGYDSSINAEEQFDTVSCQFAMHYCFGSKDRAEAFFRNVASRLKPNGRFVCTYTDGETMLNHLDQLSGQKDEARSDGDKALFSCQAINFGVTEAIKQLHEWEASGAPPVAEIFGCQYNFCMYPHVQDIAEYITAVPVVEALAASAGLQLACRQKFHEWYRVYRGKGLSDEEKHVSWLSTSHEFVKCDYNVGRSPGIGTKHPHPTRKGRSPNREQRDTRRDRERETRRDTQRDTRRDTQRDTRRDTQRGSRRDTRRDRANPRDDIRYRSRSQSPRI